MKIIKYLFVVCTLLIVSGSSLVAQSSVKGRVVAIDEKGKKSPLPYASVVWDETKKGEITNDNGMFSIKRPKASKAHLIASFIGYTNDTLTISENALEVEFVLYEKAQTIASATVIGRQKGSYISKLSDVKTEVITTAGLHKMACCNLAESFENSASISVGYSDAVSGTRQIRMLGLAGMYTQLLDENMPTMRGIAATNGFGYTPGQWLEGIQISKGTSSVINGFEAITGQINIEHIKPTKGEPFNLNLYGDNDSRFETNFSSSLKLNENLSTIISLHGSKDTKMHDTNKDGFADMPKGQQLNMTNRWELSTKAGHLRAGIQALTDNKEGGQVHTSSADPYLSSIKNKHFKAFTKYGIFLGDDGINSLAIMANYAFHQQNSVFGKKTYDAKQNSFVSNLLWQWAWDKEQHHFSVIGLTFMHDKYYKQYGDSKHLNTWDGSKSENSTGMFAEYTFKPSDDLSIIGGIRVDRNNFYKRTFVTPRTHLRYQVAKNSTVRASIGRGFRSPNVIADNIGMLATGRKLNIVDDIKPEEAWTVGASFTQNFQLKNNNGGYVSFDFFRTWFQNQTIVDTEMDAGNIYVGNLDGKSYANCYQVDFSIDPFERFNIFATFRYNQTRATTSQGLVDKPLTDQFKALVNIAYSTKFEKWRFDFTAQLNGRSRIPKYAANTLGFDYSQNYPMFFAQVTKKFKNLDIYLGVENIANYKQKTIILNAENPFDDAFDASVVYAPIMGRKIYLGIRFKLMNY